VKKKPTFVKLNRTEATEYLLQNHPNAFLLLTQIAIRARREPEYLLELDVCESVVGDYRKIGLSHRQYRTAIDVLINDNLIVKHSTNKGTVVKLICSNIYDINVVEDDKQTTNKKSHERQVNDKQEVIPETTNKNDKNIKKERIKEERTKTDSLLNYLELKITDYGYTDIQEKIIEFFHYRQSFPKAKRYKSDKGINGLFRHIKNLNKSGLNIFECLEMTMEEGWQTPDPKYFLNNQKGNQNQVIDAAQEFINIQRGLEVANGR